MRGLRGESAGGEAVRGGERAGSEAGVGEEGETGDGTQLRCVRAGLAESTPRGGRIGDAELAAVRAHAGQALQVRAGAPRPAGAPRWRDQPLASRGAAMAIALPPGWALDAARALPCKEP